MHSPSLSYGTTTRYVSMASPSENTPLRVSRKPLNTFSVNTLESRVAKTKKSLLRANISFQSVKKPVPTSTLNQRKSLLAQRRSLGNPRKSLLVKSMCLDDFEIGKVLGKGKLGKVYCVKHKASGFISAIKVMAKKDLMDLKLEKNFRREIEIQLKLKHPRVSRLLGFFHDDKNVYLILEYALHGELYQHLKVKRRFDNITASNYIFQVADALSYLHANNVIHRDIKPENILLSTDKTIKLSDFGWSVTHHPSHKRLTICGTLDYLPPEMVESKEHDFGVDIWALGILLYEFLVGKPPFEEVDKNATYKRIARVDLEIPAYIDPDAADLIKRLLQKNPEKRLPLKDVATHPWIEKNKPFWPKQKH